jgi:N-acetyl-beta-hexosaminidase
VAGFGGRLTAVELRAGDPEPVGGLYSPSEVRFIIEAASEKGISTLPRFRVSAAMASSLNW